MKFYPSDWRGDPKLRMCSLAARGLWADMLALMHEATPYGHLLINGKAPDAKQLAMLVGARAGEVQFLVNELDAAGVFSRNDAGIIYSRRMQRDAAKAERDRANGKRGGNPNISATDNPPDNGSVKRGVNPQDNGEDKAQMPDAIASSEAKASGVPPPSDSTKALFDFGVSVLTGSGQSEKDARSIIGKWRKNLNDDGKLMGLLITAKNQSAVEPVAYIAKALEREKSRSKFGPSYVPMHPGAGG
jgi:hypothetical protein